MSTATPLYIPSLSRHRRRWTGLGGRAYATAVALLIRCQNCRANLEQDGELYRARCVSPTCSMFGLWVSKQQRRRLA